MKIWKPKRNLPLRIRRIAVIVFFFFARPVPELLIAGLGAMAAGTVIMILSYAVLTKRDKLTTRGPYAFCRHPAYFGMLVSGLGFCLATGYHLSCIILSAAFIVISVPLYYRKVKFEEKRLTEEIHGEDYRSYKKRVRRRLLPSLISGIRNGGFSVDFSFEAGIRNHSFKRATKDSFWFLTFVAKWYYLEGFHPFGHIRWTGRCHDWFLTGALLTMLTLFLLSKYLEHHYRKTREIS